MTSRLVRLVFQCLTGETEGVKVRLTFEQFLACLAFVLTCAIAGCCSWLAC